IHITFSFHTHQEMDQQYPTVAKIPMLDTGKFEQWQFWKQQYLQHEHYAMWDVIEFGDSYEVPTTTVSATITDTTSGETIKKSGRTVTLTAEDMQKKKNNQYGNFKTKGSETLEQTFNRLQVIVGQLQFMDVEIEQDTLITSSLPVWLPNGESEVQKKLEPNTQNMAFISSAKHISENEDGNSASVSTASTNVPTACANIRVASISQDTACAYIASQSSCSQIKFEDINQIDEHDMEEMDIKWSMALLSMRADKFWKKTRKKISIQGSDVAGFDKSKVECFNFHKMGHFARDCRAPKSQDRGRRDNYKQREDHALVADEEAPTEFSLMSNTSTESKKEKERVDGKLAGFLTALKDLDNLIKSQRADKNKDGLGYSDINQIDEDDMEEMDVKWSMALLSMRADKFWKKTRQKISIQGSDVAGFDKSKVECFNFHKMGHFAREVGWDWSDMANDGEDHALVADEEAPTEFALMSNTSTESKASDNPTEGKIDKAEKAKKSPVKKRVKKGTSRHQDDTHKSFTSRPGDYRPYRPLQRPIRSNMNGARPNRTSFNKQAHSYANRPFQRTSAGSSQNKIDDKGYWDSGCSRHMTGNISYLSDYEPFDGGYVSFGQRRMQEYWQRNNQNR
nr:hypothetical protein [Tanacetum cinerariifolium]